jgi:hypothetical protein
MPEITIPINGRNVTFKATGGTGYRYKAQFGREFIADAIELDNFRQSARTTKKKVNGKMVETTEYDFTKYSLDFLYNILWVLAKTADDSIPSPQAWLDSFDSFPVMEIMNKVAPIIQQNMKVDIKNG